MNNTQLGKYLDLYDRLINRLSNVKNSYWTISTYPYHPDRGEIPERDKYFDKLEKFTEQNNNIDFRRMVTITHISKYHWVKNMIDRFRRHPNYSIGYLDITEFNRHPFLGMMILDKKELFMTAVTDPKAEALYFSTSDEKILHYFLHYYETTWEQFCIKLVEKGKIFRDNIDSLYESLKRPNIEIINFNSTKSKLVKSAVIQLDLSKDIKKDHDLSLLTINPDHKNEYLNKLECITNFCLTNNCDLIVFPELSYTKELEKHFKNITKNDQSIIIGGSFYNLEKNKINMSPIFIGGELYYTEKIQTSPYETSIFNGVGCKKGINVKIFKNTSVGTFAVVICMDYLESKVMHEILAKEDVDFLIVVAMNNNSNLFFSSMYWLCESQKNGIYILYANSINNNKIPIGGKEKNVSDGNSAIWGVMDKRYLSFSETKLEYKLKSLSNNEEGIIMADFDIEHKRPPLASIPTDQNVRNISVYIFNKDKEDNYIFSKMKDL